MYDTVSTLNTCQKYKAFNYAFKYNWKYFIITTRSKKNLTRKKNNKTRVSA